MPQNGADWSPMKITIETAEDDGGRLERCSVELESGVSYEFDGRAVSELRLNPSTFEEIDVTGAMGRREFMRGLLNPDEWTFTVTVDRIRELKRGELTGGGHGRLCPPVELHNRCPLEAS